MASDLQRRAVQRLIRKAEKMGVGDQVPAVLHEIVSGHGASNGGALAWVKLHPEAEDVFVGCCTGEMMNGASYCTCWVPVFDLEQSPELIPPGDGEIQVREGGLCGDCAYRPGSPELADDYMAETLRELPLRGETFWCHDGMRRAIRWEHPDGRVVEAGYGDYQPPMLANRPHRADGRVGALCAGWAACSRTWDNRLEKETRTTRAPEE
jgi:hypothetical protein